MDRRVVWIGAVLLGVSMLVSAAYAFSNQTSLADGVVRAYSSPHASDVVMVVNGSPVTQGELGAAEADATSRLSAYNGNNAGDIGALMHHFTARQLAIAKIISERAISQQARQRGLWPDSATVMKYVENRRQAYRPGQNPDEDMLIRALGSDAYWSIYAPDAYGRALAKMNVRAAVIGSVDPQTGMTMWYSDIAEWSSQATVKIVNQTLVSQADVEAAMDWLQQYAKIFADSSY